MHGLHKRAVCKYSTGKIIIANERDEPDMVKAFAQRHDDKCTAVTCMSIIRRTNNGNGVLRRHLIEIIMVLFRSKDRAEGEAKIPSFARSDVLEIDVELGIGDKTDAMDPGKVRGQHRTDRETDLHCLVRLTITNQANIQ
jgi:hypothetical protein